MKTSSIVNLLRVFAVVCLLVGGIAALAFAFENSDIAVPLVIISIFVAAGGFVTYSAIANMMEAIDSMEQTNAAMAKMNDAIDSIAQTNKRIVDILEQQDFVKKNNEQQTTVKNNSEQQIPIKNNQEQQPPAKNDPEQQILAKKEPELSESLQKINTYWAEHAEEKQRLESEKNTLEEQLKKLSLQITLCDREISDSRRQLEKEVPSKVKKAAVLSEISKLRNELSALGMFKDKEKKALQEQIDELNAKASYYDVYIKEEEKEQIETCNEKIKTAEERMKPLKEEIEPLQKRLAEINNELTKDR